MYTHTCACAQMHIAQYMHTHRQWHSRMHRDEDRLWHARSHKEISSHPRQLSLIRGAPHIYQRNCVHQQSGRRVSLNKPLDSKANDSRAIDISPLNRQNITTSSGRPKEGHQKGGDLKIESRCEFLHSRSHYSVLFLRQCHWESDIKTGKATSTPACWKIPC